MIAPAILILGGGTAGWMAACLMARAWPAAAITVVETPATPTIGVGEGSTPQLRGFVHTLGVAEHDWMSAWDATYKAGIDRLPGSCPLNSEDHGAALERMAQGGRGW